ncbi:MULTISPECIES: MATE family efflux transporter [unclassified Fusobacterium]|uniref:MATE family efflux transporter n=1 Tax=unclassified Fusobacterium TaxID=2648384 RepID=UPI0025B952E9|nr:MATE family efflux transporter [Fusobacterium sp.]
MSKNLNLGKESISKLFFTFAIPSTLSMLVVSLYNIADGIFITRGVGSDGVAAVNIGYPVINFTVALSLMFGIGGATLIAFKKNDIEYQNKCFSHIILLNIIVYAIVAIAIFVFTEPLMKTLGANDQLMPMIKGYMYPCTISTFFLMLSMSLNAVVRNDNAPRRAMISMFIGAALNIVLDYIFIFQFHLGIVGGAVATAISQIISALYLCRHFIGSTFRFKMNWKILDFRLIKRLLSIGFPSFILEFAVAVITVLLNIAFMEKAGVFGTAAYGIISYSFMFFRMLFTGLSQGIQPIVSYNFGVKKFKRVRKMFVFAHKVCFITSVVSLALIFIYSKNVVSVFTSDVPLIIESAKGFILYSIALSFLGFNFVNIAYLQAVESPSISNIICMSRSFLFVFIALMILPRVLGINGIWLALPFADFITAVLTYPFLKKFMMRYTVTRK